MNYKKTLLVALATSVLGFGTAQASDGAIYEITAVKGKALIQLPGGERLQAKPGMRVVNGSEIIVLRNSQVNGFDIENKCEVEYQERVRTSLVRGKICHPEALAHASKPMYAPKPVAGGGGYGGGYSYAPLVAIGGIALLAAALDDDDKPASP